MPENAPGLISRSQWQRLRDKYGVKQGAAKVSIGDGIDAVHKAWNKAPMNFAETALKMNALIKDLKVYQAAVKVKAPKLVTEIDNNLIKEMEKQIKFWTSQANPSKECADAIRNGLAATERVKSSPTVPMLTEAYAGPIRFVGMALKGLAAKPGFEPVTPVRDYWYKCEAVKAFSGGADKIATSTDPEDERIKKIHAVCKLLKEDLDHVAGELKKLHIMS
jgi:hypothetical protein